MEGILQSTRVTLFFITPGKFLNCNLVLELFQSNLGDFSEMHGEHNQDLITIGVAFCLRTSRFICRRNQPFILNWLSAAPCKTWQDREQKALPT